jgi:outer membrane biosynthesis protein TonB
MANQFIIRPAPRQNFEAFVRYVVGLAEGARVETDTSGSPYFVRVDEGTYRRWIAALPKKPAADAEPEPQPEPEGSVPAAPKVASASVEESAPAAEAPAEAPAPREPQPEPEPPKPVAKRAKGRTASASRKRTTGGN